MTHYGQNEVNHQKNISFLVGHTKNNSDSFRGCGSYLINISFLVGHTKNNSDSFRGCGSYLIKNLFKSWYLVEHKVGICSSDSRSNIAHSTRKKANKQISLADQGLTRSFHWSRATCKTSGFSFFDPLTIF